LDKKTVNQVTSRVYKALLRERDVGRVVGQNSSSVLAWTAT